MFVAALAEPKGRPLEPRAKKGDMPQTKSVPVKDLSLDLGNFRTVRQKTELDAIEAMISTSSDRFWALTNSLLDDGYLPTESIIVLQGNAGSTGLIVKEGNRRVGAMKLIHGLISLKKLSVPSDIADRIKNVPKEWRTANEEVPCTIFAATQKKTVDRIVTLAHGKGEKAGRDQWNAVARARHNRDENGASEPALDLLEKYLEHGKNATLNQKSGWACYYPLSLLEEAMKKVAPRMGVATAPALAAAYPSLTDRDALEGIIYDVGQQLLRFEGIRSKDVDFAAAYGLAPVPSSSAGSTKGGAAGASGGKAGTGASAGAAKKAAKGQKKALSVTNPKAIKGLLKAFVPKGKNRQKLVALKEEAMRLDVAKTPLAFSFLLRSMFEVSAKAYCLDHASTGGPSLKKKDGNDRPLAEVLKDIMKHLSKNNTDKEMRKTLHGAITEIAKPEGLLSVTSMNQLVHNPKFSITPSDVAVRFGNVLPLLEAMSQ